MKVDKRKLDIAMARAQLNRGDLAKRQVCQFQRYAMLCNVRAADQLQLERLPLHLVLM